MSAPYVPPYRAALAAAAAAPAAPKLAQGVIQLQPMRGADLIRQAQENAATTPAAPTTARYLPPSKRGAEPPKLKTLTSADMESAELFPTLGGSKKVVAAPQPAPASAASLNAFAVLDEDAESVASSAPGPLDFKKMLKTRVRKDREEAALAVLPETDNPSEMTQEQLEREGWAVLRRPFGSQPDPLQGLGALRDFVEKASPSWRDGPLDPEQAYYENGDTWTTIGIPPELLVMGKERELMAYCCRTHNEEVPDYEELARKEAEAREAREALRTTRGQANKLCSLLERKRAHRAAHGPGEAELRAAEATSCGADVVGSLDALRAKIVA